MQPDELRRLVETIVDEVLGLTRPSQTHAGRAADVAALIDHTLLRPEATRRDIDRLCDEALEFGFAAVCVNPAWVGTASRRLASSHVAVCSVAGFPFGASTPDAKAYEARRALFDGAREIDMVINIGALRSGDLRLVQKDIEAVTIPVREAGALSKAIIEASFLTDDEKVTACTLAKAAGADFVKTSTGFGPGGATAADVILMRRVVGTSMGVKAAGGITDYAALKRMVAAGATRIGASAGVRIVQESRGQSSGHDTAARY
jgi:deoxyribose-phosphate aldolase